MDATQMISDSILESDEDENEDEREDERGRPLAKLCILKNEHIPQTELPLFLGDNVLGRDPNTCTLVLPATSVSKQHATICISVYRRRGCDSEVDIEALVWDQGSMNGTRKGRLKLTPNVRYALSESDSLVVGGHPIEDESPITPSFPTKNRPHRQVSFSEETDEDVGRQQLKEKKALAIVSGGKEGEGKEEERAALGGRKFEESGQNVPVKQGSDVSLRGEGISPVSTPTDFTGAIPAFNMDSDTDMEGEEEGATAVGPVTLNTNQQAGQPPNTAQFHLDSDTDVDEDDDAIVSKSVPPSADNTKPSCVISLIKPEGITMDSDTDVDDEAATKAKPTSFQNTHTADIAKSTQPKDFHLDSDTDVDEEEEKECVTNNTCSKIDESVPAAPHSLHLDSDTDDEAIPAPATSEPVVVSAVTESRTTADTGADLDILSDSDTDVDEHSPLVIPVVVTDVSVALDTMTEALQSDSDADTNADESNMPPAGKGVDPAKFSVDSDTDVEDKEVDFGEEGEGQIPGLQRENTPGLLAPLFQNCSTPVQLSGAVASAVRPNALSSCSGSQEDEDFVVAETQSFVLQTRDCQGNPLEDHTTDPTQAFGLESSGDEKSEQSNRGGSFQLGLSDSSHLQCQAQVEDMESTQAFVSVEGGVNLEDTQAYAAISKADRTSLEDDSNLEATQAYGEEEEHARCSVMPEREGQVDLALEATQAYVSELYNNSEDETDEDERQNTAGTRPLDFPTSSTLTIAETQPMSAFKDEESLDGENPVSSVVQVKPKLKNEKQGREEHGEAAQFAERGSSKALSVAETQPMCRSDSEESDDDDMVPGPRKRKAKPLPLEGEQTQPLTCSGLSLVETQPMHSGVDETQPIHSGVDETQPMATSGNEESDSEDSILGPRKRKAKQLRLEEEETQTLRNSELYGVETQPTDTGEHGDSDEEDSIVGQRKRKTKLLPLEEEQTQSLTISELSAIETQPMVTGEDGESDEEDSIPDPRKRKAKPLLIQEEETQSLSNSETSAVETQSLETKADLQPQRGKGRQSSSIPSRGKRGTRARVREEEEQAECSEPPKRQARGSNKALPTTRGRTAKSRHDEDESEEEEKVAHAKQARGKKSMRQQKDNEEEERERKVKEEQQRLQAENAERLRLEQERREKERIEQERKEQDEKERADRAQREKDEQLERERKEKEEKERLECEKAEREEKERIEKERKKREETEKLETAKREQEERLERERKEQEEKERADRTRKEKEEQLERERKEEEEKKRLECVKRQKEKRRIDSERSALSVNTQQSGGRGRGRGAKRTSEPPQAAAGRNSNRRRTVAAGPTEQDSKDISPHGVRSRSDSTNSLSSEISSFSSQSRGRGGRQRGRGRRTETEPHSIPAVNDESEQNPAPKPTARGRKSRKAEESSNEVSHEDDKEKADSQQASTTRGRWRADAKGSEPAAADEEDPSNQEEGCASKELLLPKKNVRGRGQKAVESETVEAPVAPAVIDRDEAKEKRKGRKRELEANTEEDSSSCPNISKRNERAQTTETVGEDEAKGETKDETSVQTKRRSRASSAQAKKNAKPKSTEMEMKEKGEKKEEETVERRARGWPSAVQKKKKEEREESGASVDQDACVEASEPQTPTSSVSRKRQAPVDSSPVAKTPRSSSASPAASGRSRIISQGYQVLFTGVVDEEGERVLARLGGSIAKGVTDMNCLVTDKVRRTVKFLCAVAKGVPIVTTHWLEKSGKAGSFLSPNGFVVKDPEQEKKFSFCLQESLRIASSQPLLHGYAIHVTKSVKPEPAQMKDIISCSGATFLPKMPSSHKPQTVVISCEEDWPLCGPALTASLPVVTAEFILTGILQQKVDLQVHSLSAPTSNLPPAGGRGRGRKRT
ncbi:hypothetical protein L3Q82_013366 [Scortum barcoo]|uniref:Uncharacterized protein n=1 Tax=Scortum barcoo TaxID=214431 RepID=A0ACB8W0F0_9TELE|nr:hypothetical protein L3Q82_013366 [Scortum barcoo]